MKTFTESKKEYVDKINKISDHLIEMKKAMQKKYQRRKKHRETFGIWIRKHYERSGFVTDAEVEHVKKKTIHTIKVMYYENNIEDMVLIVDPPLVNDMPVMEFRIKKNIND